MFLWFKCSYLNLFQMTSEQMMSNFLIKRLVNKYYPPDGVIRRKDPGHRHTLDIIIKKFSLSHIEVSVSY